MNDERMVGPRFANFASGSVTVTWRSFARSATYD